MQSKSWLLAGVLGASAAFGCGDDDGGGASSGKQISELSESELKSVCQYVQKRMTRISAALTELSCTAEGLGSDDECAETRSDCIDAAKDEPIDPDFELDCDEPPEGIEDCDATVGEFEKCAEDLAKAAESYTKKLTCSSDLEDVEELETEGPPNPASCKKLDAACGLGFGEE